MHWRPAWRSCTQLVNILVSSTFIENHYAVTVRRLVGASTIHSSPDVASEGLPSVYVQQNARAGPCCRWHSALASRELADFDLVRCFRLRCAKTEACRTDLLTLSAPLCQRRRGASTTRPQALPDEPVTASVCCFGRRRDAQRCYSSRSRRLDDIASPTAGSVEHEACATVAAIMSCLLSLLQPAAASKARSQLWSNVCALGTQLEEAEADGTARSTALFHALRRAGAVRALIDVISLIAPRCTRNLCSESGRDAPSSFRQSIDLGYDGVIGRQELEEDSLHLQELSEDIDDDHAHEEHCQTGTAPTLLQQQYGNKAAPIASEEKRAECVRCGCITPTAPHVEHYWASLEALATHIVGGLTHRCAWAADDVCQCTVSAFGAMHHAATPLLRSLQTWKGCPGVLEAAMIGGGMRVALEELNRARVEEEPTQSPAVPPSLASRSMMPTAVHAAELSNTATSASRVELSASAHGESADGAVGLQCDRCQLRPLCLNFAFHHRLCWELRRSPHGSDQPSVNDLGRGRGIHQRPNCNRSALICRRQCPIDCLWRKGGGRRRHRQRQRCQQACELHSRRHSLRGV